MSSKASGWVWLNGDWVESRAANVHISTHALHYGSSVFEGIRAYETPDGPAIFRLEDHLRRLAQSARLFRMSLPEHVVAELAERAIDLVALNQLKSCYIRPIVYRGTGTLSLDPRAADVGVALLAFEWENLLGSRAIEQGISAGVSSYRRVGPEGAFCLAKIGGQYVIHQLATIEARENGFDEALLLDEHGFVAEGAGENVFAVFGGELVTPPVGAAILAGITRDTVLEIARDLALPVRSERLSRDQLLSADEIFLTGTAAEVTPVVALDRLPVGAGRPGPLTRRIQRAFFGLVSGKLPDTRHWLTYVPQCETVLV